MHEADGSSAFSTRLGRRRFLARLAQGTAVGAAGWLARARAAQGAKAPELAFQKLPDAIELKLGPRPLYRYQLTKPALGGATTDSACYFHPIFTPSGVPVTDLGPDDHRHHRGLFFGFVEVKGAQHGDFWGWGEPAPTKGRRIVHVSMQEPVIALGYARLGVVNAWQVDGQTILREDGRFGCGVRENGNILDLTYRLAAESETTLAPWAFGGLAVRLRKDAEIKAFDAQGAVSLPAPKHTDPATDWPDQPWYGLHLKFADGKEATVVLVGRATNPPTRWHVVSSIGLLNPSVTAAGALKLTPDKPLVLKYQLMVWDGPPNTALINDLADKWYHGRI